MDESMLRELREIRDELRGYRVVAGSNAKAKWLEAKFDEFATTLEGMAQRCEQIDAQLESLADIQTIAEILIGEIKLKRANSDHPSES